jgi:hypothetical protein
MLNDIIIILKSVKYLKKLLSSEKEEVKSQGTAGPVASF